MDTEYEFVWVRAHELSTLNGERAMLPKLPRAIEILNVDPGSTGGSNAGIYVTTDATVTVHIEGDGNGVFQVARVETDDVVTDPNPPPGHPPLVTLQPALVVDGPGPIDVFAGQAIRVYVTFSCPSDPAQAVYRATAVMAGSGLPAAVNFPITATARLGTLQAVSLATPNNMYPGDTENFTFRIDSSLGVSVDVVFAYDSAAEPHFSAPSQTLTVSAGANLILPPVPVTCLPGTPIGDYSAVFRLRAQDGSRDFGYVQPVITVILQPIVVTTIDPLSVSVNMTAGGITPVNLTLQSIQGGATQVFFSLEGSPPGLSLSGPPISVDSGASVHGTIWINAAEDAPEDTTVRLVQSTLNGPQATPLPTNVYVSVLPPPPLEDFLIVRVYWGSKWTGSGPFTWLEMDSTIVQLANSAFVRGLREYGVRTVHTSSVDTVAVVATFPQSGQFDDSDVTGLITGLINSNAIPRPDAVVPTPLYVVFPQQGSIYGPNPRGLIGAHGTFSYGGADCLYAWVYQGGDIPGTTKGFGHELAEALCAKAAGGEIGDPCERLLGESDGITLQPYLSKQRNLCVLPDMTNNSDVAATTPPPPPKKSP